MNNIENKTDNWIVSDVQLEDEIKKDYTVKIYNGIEKFWVLVTSTLMMVLLLVL